ncbi:MAG: hypothetical protein D6782_13055 [Alphaproteobacteria bacterium]|nr:MAG: hypothetical protein D6782_13055 [Alphaproteobacteria bacterium]
MKITGNASLAPLLAAALDGARQQPAAGNAADLSAKGQNAKPRSARPLEPAALHAAAAAPKANAFSREAPLAGRAPKFVAPGQILNIVV